MANVSILWDKLSDRGTLSGGSWTGGLPLTNLQTVDVQRVARSSSASAADTRFRIDMGTTPARWSRFVLLNHNLSAVAKWRIVVTSDASDASIGARVLDTGLIDVWPPTILYGGVPWGFFPWDGIDTSIYPAGTVAMYLHPTAVTGRYLWVYLSDASNADGYVQAGRFLAGESWSPKVNVAYGASIQWIDRSEVKITRGGRRLVNQRPRFRRLAIRFDALTESEAMGVALEADRQLGRGGDFFVTLDPDARAEILFRQSIYAALVDTAPAAIPNYGNWSWTMTAEELI